MTPLTEQPFATEIARASRHVGEHSRKDALLAHLRTCDKHYGDGAKAVCLNQWVHRQQGQFIVCEETPELWVEDRHDRTSSLASVHLFLSSSTTQMLETVHENMRVATVASVTAHLCQSLRTLQICHPTGHDGHILVNAGMTIPQGELVAFFTKGRCFKTRPPTAEHCMLDDVGASFGN